ncbi:flagellar hook-length control protein FliK [Rhabdochromatium marinum]|uniref:flagellar hook-length control protein FliK n=1 Tax=Rhabdochromatium marinum TaxID=48729 RepID=UPI001908826F|nr:flagellar hook-length control protein FliK [Rhabdochromatium marinum]MBK1647457.1 hypothetical protein [Rhabdochromatium marinum]
MADFTQVNPRAGSHSPPVRSQAPETATLVRGTRVAAQAQDSARLALGSRVEVQLKSVLRSGDLEVRLRALGQNAQNAQPAPRGQWSQTMRVGITDALRPALLEALRTLSTDQSRQGSILKAEVVSLNPRIMLRLMHSDGAEAPGTKAWFVAQVRAHWPGAQRLTNTFANWARNLQESKAASPLSGRAEAGKQPSQTGQTQTTTKVPLPPGQAEASKALATPERAQSVQHSELNQAIKEILNRLASPRELTDPQRLPVTLKNSGIWLEALLARAAVTPNQRLSLEADLKGQLLRLAQQLRATPAPSSNAGAKSGPQRASDPPTGGGADRLLQQPATALSREVHGMLKQLVTLQLQSADHAPDPLRWAVELPFQSSAGLLALDADIQRESTQDEEDPERWSMQLRLDLPVLGPLLISLILHNDRLHASLVAEQSAGAAKLRERLPELRAQLEKREIEVASLHAREGSTERPPKPEPPLLNEQA